MLHRIFVAVSILVLGWATLAPAQMANPLASAQKQWLDGFNAGDAAKVAAVYASDAVMMPPNESMLKGRVAIAKWMKDGFTSMGAAITLTPFASSHSGDMAYVAGTYSMTWKGPDGKSMSDKGKYVEIWKKDGADWKIAYDIYNSDTPPAPPAPAKKATESP